MSEADRDIRGVLITVIGGKLLLPNASVAEIITFAEPERVADAPPWLLGRVRWRGWRLPVLSFSRLAGLAEEEGELGSKVVVIKALGGNPRLPFFALLTQGFPRLVTVARERLLGDADSEAPLGVLQQVLLNDDKALVPDLDTVEMLVTKALEQAA